MHTCPQQIFWTLLSLKLKQLLFKPNYQKKKKSLFKLEPNNLINKIFVQICLKLEFYIAQN